jgi:hypothetical protein
MNARLSFVAHPDDDLLFFNPDLISDFPDAVPSWTVYLTAGNIVTGPGGMAYADERIKGLRAAYLRAAKVTPTPGVDPWVWDEIILPSGRKLTTNYMQAKPHIRLVFPFINAAHGGDPDGDLRRMWLNPSFVAQPIDNRPAYTRASFVAMLKELIAHVDPEFLRITDPYGQQIGDHVDHAHAGRFAATANLDTAGKVVRRMDSYFGYAAKYFTQNVSGYWENEKQAAFEAYNAFDPELQPGAWSEMPTRQHRRHVWFPGDTWFDLQW